MRTHTFPILSIFVLGALACTEQATTTAAPAPAPAAQAPVASSPYAPIAVAATPSAPATAPAARPMGGDEFSGDGAPPDELADGGKCKEGRVMCSGRPPKIDAPGYKPVGANVLTCKGGTWVVTEDCTKGDGLGCYQRGDEAYCGSIGD